MAKKAKKVTGYWAVKPAAEPHAETVKSSPKKTWHVIFTVKGNWIVRGASSGQFTNSKSYSKKDDAVRHAVESAKKERSIVLVHGRDGRIQSSATYGNEPYLPQSLRYK
jgi:hypothetical protein